MDYLGASDDFGPRDVIAGEAPDSILSLISQDFMDHDPTLDDDALPTVSSPPADDSRRNDEESFAFPCVDSDLSLAAFPSDVDDGGNVGDVSPASLYEETLFSPWFEVKQEALDDCPTAFTEVVLDVDSSDYSNYVHKSESDQTVYVEKVRRPSESSSYFSSSSPTTSDDDQEISPLPLSFDVLPTKVEVAAAAPTGTAAEQVKKPRMSYAQLIAEALMNATNRRLTLNEIYVHINARHPFFSLKGGKNWQNAIRHNLTLNKSFVKVPRPANEGRGSYWELEAGAEKAIFKRLLRQRYMYNVAVDAAPATVPVIGRSFSLVKNTAVRPPPPAAISTAAAGASSKSKSQIKIIRSVPLLTKAAKVSAAVSASSATKPTVIYVTLPKNLVK